MLGRTFLCAKLGAWRSVNLTRTLTTSISISPKLGVVGGGHMAKAIVSCLYADQCQNMNDIIIYDLEEDKMRLLARDYGVQYTTNIIEAVTDSDMILLAIKPQNLQDFAAELDDKVTWHPNCTLISILAGCNIDTLTTNLR